MPVIRTKKAEENNSLANNNGGKFTKEKAKRVSQNSPKDAPAKKRSAFGDITNVRLPMIFHIFKVTKTVLVVVCLGKLIDEMET